MVSSTGAKTHSRHGRWRIMALGFFVVASVLVLCRPAGPFPLRWEWNQGGAARSIWEERDYIALNRQFDLLGDTMPADLVKAIAWCESEWRQTDGQGRPFITINRHQANGRRWSTADWGLMQINERMDSLDPEVWDWARIKKDPAYNLRAGMEVLKNKRRYVRNLKRKVSWPRVAKRYNLNGHNDWDITLKAYNGFQPSWRYVNRVRRVMREKPWEAAARRQIRVMYRRKFTESMDVRYSWPEPMPGFVFPEACRDAGFRLSVPARAPELKIKPRQIILAD